MIACIIPTEARQRLQILGKKRCKHGPNSNETADVNGVCGEYAVAEYLGTEMDETIYVGGDGGVDLHWNGMTVAVKHNHHYDGKLMFPADNPEQHPSSIESFTADVAVLTAGLCVAGHCKCSDDNRTVLIVGWIGRDEFLAHCYPRDYGNGGRYVVSRKYLRPMHTLVSSCGSIPAPEPELTK